MATTSVTMVRTLLAAGSLIVGCGGTGNGCPPFSTPDGGLTCVGGTGNQGFEPLANGETVHLVKGPQGGDACHIWIAARAGARPGGAIVVHVTARLAQGGMLIGTPLGFELLPSDCTDQGVERSGMRYQLSIDPALVRGQSVVFHFDARLPDGTVCSDERTVLVL